MTATKTYHVADLFSVYSGCLLTLRGVEAIYDVVDFVTGQPHMTHQLPRAMEQTVGPELLRQHPWLADIETPDVSTEAEVTTWSAWAADAYGEMHDVQALPEGAYVGREPFAELREMAPDLPIISVGEPPADLDGGPRS